VRNPRQPDAFVIDHEKDICEAIAQVGAEAGTAVAALTAP
jgi:hypothetical protein